MGEVQFSQMSPEVRQKYNAKLIGIVNVISRICNENNIKWFVAYGSCIGAVRHKGCIPWDDDIDVCMPRPDYERFLTVCRSSDLGNFELATITDMPDFYEHFARVYDKNTTLYFGNNLKHVGGIFVDVFPLDGAGAGPRDPEVAKNCEKILFWQMILHHSYFYYTQTQRFELLKKRKIAQYFLVVATSLFRKKAQKISINKIECYLRKYPYDTSEYVGFYNRISGLKSLLPKEWFNEVIIVPFENIEVPIPKMYDNYLTAIYGDYMTPPPENKRDAGNTLAYLNMERRLSLEEIKKMV